MIQIDEQTLFNFLIFLWLIITTTLFGLLIWASSFDLDDMDKELKELKERVAELEAKA